MGEAARNDLCPKGEANKVDEAIWKHFDEDLRKVEANNCCSIVRSCERVWFVLVDYFGSNGEHVSDDADRAW